MTKRAQSKYKISRRLGVNLWGRAKDPVNEKNFPPGQHGLTGHRKATDYGTQLRAKQKLKGYYGNVSEKQMVAYYKEAIRRKGDSSENLVGLLEKRLDTVVYRMNFVPTVFAARQFVNHKHVKVNGKTVNIPSFQVKEGDVIEIKEKSKQLTIVLEAAQNQERSIPEFLEVDNKAGKGKFIRTPKLAEIPYPIVMEPHLIIEFYSR